MGRCTDSWRSLGRLARGAWRFHAIIGPVPAGSGPPACETTEKCRVRRGQMSVQKRLEWGEALITGVPEIDEQHMILVHTLNEAAERLGRECSADILGQITQDLLGYALYHFDTEEELMQQSGYSEQDAAMQALHLEQHRSFSAKVVSIRESLTAGTLINSD